MENHALDIIDMLYNMIAEAWGVPLGNDKCIVERDKALNLLDDLKATLPMELREARRLVNARVRRTRSSGRNGGRYAAGCGGQRVYQRLNPFNPQDNSPEKRISFAQS